MINCLLMRLHPDKSRKEGKSVVLETGIIGGWHFFLVPANNPVS
jgi:hypothetical protein